MRQMTRALEPLINTAVDGALFGFDIRMVTNAGE